VGQKYFCRGGKVAKLDFHDSKIRKQTTFKNVTGKCQISKSSGCLGLPFDDHAPKNSYGKKAEEDKIYLPISI